MYNAYLRVIKPNKMQSVRYKIKSQTAGAKNLTDNTRYANQLAASVDTMNNGAKPTN